MTAVPLRIAVLALGFSTIVVQMVVLREMLGVFAGNELTLGIVLAAWLLLTGAGGLLGRRGGRSRGAGIDPLRGLLAGLAGIGILPLLEVAGLRFASGLLPAGLPSGVGGVLGVSLLLLLPFCLLAGFFLVRLTRVASPLPGAASIGDVYALDAAGSVAGGLFFSLGFLHLLPPFGTLTVLLVLNLLAAMVLARRGGRRRAFAVLAGVLLAAMVVIRAVDPEILTARATMPADDLVFRRTTAYGVLAATRTGGQIDVYESGVPLASTGDRASAEEIVHPALAQLAKPRDVLLIGGTLTGAVAEVVRHGVERLDVVELDPEVFALAARIGMGPLEAGGVGMGGPRIRAITGDARQWVRDQRGVYDAILLALPDPSTALINRYYTVEFFEEARRALRPEGVLSLRLTAAENYADPELRVLTSSIHRAIRAAFPHLLMIPCARQLWLASDRPLDPDIAGRLARRGIETATMHAGYLAARLTADRVAAAREAASQDAPVNRDARPASYHVLLLRWLHRMGGGFLFPGLLAAGILILLASLVAGSPRRAVAASIGSSGFAGMALEVCLLLAFQARFGSVYRQIGLLLTAFLAGAAAGAWRANRTGTLPPAAPAAGGSSRAHRPAGVAIASRLARVDGALAAAALLLAPLLEGILSVEGTPVLRGLAGASLPLLNGVIGFLVGAQLPLAAGVLWRETRRTAGRLYALDLLGASLGALAVSALCIPLLGLTGTCGVVGALKITSWGALRLEASRGLRLAPRGARPESHLGRVPARGRRAGRKVAAAGICLLLAGAMGAAIVSEETSGWIYGLSFAPLGLWALAIVLGAGVWMAIDPPLAGRRLDRLRRAARRAGHAIQESTTLRPFAGITYLTAALAAFYPLFRCYFRVPYLFCHVCPRRCVFGFVRPFLVPAALLMNLEKRFWCHRACPLGTLQGCVASTRGRVRRVPRAFLPLSLGVLLFTAVTYVLVQRGFAGDPAPGWDAYTAWFRNTFSVQGSVLAVAGGLLAGAFFFRRPFCELLCPIGRFSELLLGLERRAAGGAGRGSGGEGHP